MGKQKKFGTFGGVFTPSILTILGVIMYLRLPMIIGQAGLLATLGIILLAHVISITTGLSVSSTATDKKVEAGGTYYMISRSLGLPIGGTLGIALFVGLSFSVSLYLIGFSESFLNFWGMTSDLRSIRITGTIVLLAVTILTFISTSLAIKTQYLIMIAIILSLISVFSGNHNFAPSATIDTDLPSTVPLMVLFGIFFPAVTGFEAGVSMSGDLKDPKRSIPQGAILAISVGLIVYIVLTIFLSSTVSRNMLATDPNILLKISWIPELVVAGIWGATLSSALGSILGAPRILQAVSLDRITPKFFAKGFGPTKEPRNALLLTFVIAEAGILIGELDVIARVVSIFFITTYGFLNTSAAFESWTSADFRPEFKVPGWISTIGAVACLIVMIQLDLIAMVAAVLILGLLFLYLKRKELSLETGDTWSGVWSSLVRTGLTRLKTERSHTRNWKPNIIMFSGNPETRKNLVDLGKAICGRLGVLSAFELIKSKDHVLTRSESVLTQSRNTTGFFHHKLFCHDVWTGMDEIARLFGFSGVEPNTILMGWSSNPETKNTFTTTIKNFDRYGFNTLFSHFDPDRGFGEQHTIDIWWNGASRNLAFAINLVRHITLSKLWKSSSIRVLLINPVNENHDTIYRAMNSILDNFRLDANIKIVNNQFKQLPENEIIISESSKTDLIILGVPDRKIDQIDKYFQQISLLINDLGSMLAIHASENFEYYDVLGSAQEGYQLEQQYETEKLKIPELVVSNHPEIAKDIGLTDTHFRRLLEIFFLRAFKPIYINRIEFLDNLNEKSNYLCREIEDIASIRESFRRRKAIDKLKNDIFFKINQEVSEGLKGEKLPQQDEQLCFWINWYTEQLKTDFHRYPKHLTISYKKEEFSINRNDSFRLRFYKHWKRMVHRIVGYPIKHNVRYRELVHYFLLSNRLRFLGLTLRRFREEEEVFYSTIQAFLNKLTRNLDETERKIWNSEKGWENGSLFRDLSDELSAEINKQQIQMKRNYGRLDLEFRKNLQVLNDELEKIQVGHSIYRKRLTGKQFHHIKQNIQRFQNEYYALTENHLNKILLELAVNAIRNRLETLHVEYHNDISHYIDVHYFRRLEDLEEMILRKENHLAALMDIELNTDFEIGLNDAFDQYISRLRDHIVKMPDKFEIYSGRMLQGINEGEVMEIPLAKMTEHFLETRYITPAEEKFIELIESLKRSALSIQDGINLTRFNLENYKTEGDKVLEEILTTFKSKLEHEKDISIQKSDEYLNAANEYFDRVFEPLSSLRIEESVDKFMLGLRTYQGKRVISGVSSWLESLKVYGRQFITRLLYIQSEGILLTKKYVEDKSLYSVSSRLLDLKERVNPGYDLLHTLPPYYVTLFNGRSSISDEFWIHRKEEDHFKKALKRYQQGNAGGILILGERNMGKTAFCKYISHNLLKNQAIYSIFPTTTGTIHEADFEELLNKATGQKGDIFQNAGYLEKGSVIIINDLELFWERSTEGTRVIQLIERLIDQYSHRLLIIININPFAFKILNQLTRFSEHFIDIITIKPFDAEELKDLIMRRHQSSGLAIGYDQRSTGLNEIQVARLFNAYFTYSKGNPGTALNGWLANIIDISTDTLVIKKPQIPSTNIIKSLDSEWLMMLCQFIYHKRLDIGKISRITGWDVKFTEKILHAMTRSGFIIEKVSGLYIIDPYIQPFATRVLIDMDLL